MQWITHERPNIDRIACPWLIARFIDKEAQFLHAPPEEVMRLANNSGAIPFDVPGVELSHTGDLCSFDAFLNRYALTDPALQQMAVIVRAAGKAPLKRAPQSAGLYALSLGLSKLSNLYADDLDLLRHGMILYDALYAWCQHSQGETQQWLPKINQDGLSDVLLS